MALADADADATTVAVQDCPAPSVGLQVVAPIEKPIPDAKGTTPSAGRGLLLVSVKVRFAVLGRGSGPRAPLTEKVLPPLQASWGGEVAG